jgi:uncharacterized repeat protein (TIGR01451 family)
MTKTEAASGVHLACRIGAACLSGCLMTAAVATATQEGQAGAEQVSANPLDVVINEIAWMGTEADYRDEWIELYNNTEQVIELTGWSIVAYDGTPAVSLTGAISASGYYLLERSDDAAVSDIPADLIYTGALENDPAAESLVLLGADGQVVDTANVDGGPWPAGHNDTKATMERVDPGATDSDANWCTNDGLSTRGSDADGNPILGTAGGLNSCYSPPGLGLIKTGPRAATSGEVLTYLLTLVNSGAQTTAGTVLTDAIPPGMEFADQISAFPFSQPAPGLLRWEAGDLPPATACSVAITLEAAPSLQGTVTNVATATAAATGLRSSSWSTAVHPGVLIYALAPGSYAGSGEAIALINTGSVTASLAGWSISDDPATRAVSLPSGSLLPPGQVVWLAQDADAFYPIWGFDAHWASQAAQRPVPTLDGSWPAYLFTDTGESAYLVDAEDNVIDALAYGAGSAETGWVGMAVPHPYPGYPSKQVLYRKLDQHTGRPVPDTDTASDWAQDPEDPIDGRKVRLPGWDLEQLFHPTEVTATAAITLAVAPDAALEVVSQTIAGARRTLCIQAYTLESEPLYHAISERIRAGVVVTVLLESGPAGGIDDAQSWIAERLHAPPSSTVYFIGEAAPRYRCQHAKFILVDEALALVSTDNFAENSMPSDPKENGTFGQRGFIALTNSPAVISRLGEVFRRDCDAAHHVDVVPYDSSYAAPPGFEPLEPPDWTSYSAPFTASLTTTATHLNVVHAPENALRDQDSLLGLLGQAGAGDQIAVMGMTEPVTWTTGAGSAGLNPRLQALIRAARRGADVRVLLDSYYEDEESPDGNTACCIRLNGLASAEGLSLSCRLGNVAGLGIHAKLLAISVGGQRWLHLGSINGTESSSKANREVALQLETVEGYDWTLEVFNHDWQLGLPPLSHRSWLPVLCAGYVAPSSQPLITELLVNPEGVDTEQEWIELHNPGGTADIGGWLIGDALSEGAFGDGRYAFPPDSIFERGQVLIVAACASRFSANYGFLPDYEWTECSEHVSNLEPTSSWEGFGLALGNNADEILLMAPALTPVDSVAWGGSARAGVIPFTEYTSTLPRGASLKRYPPWADRDDCSTDFYLSFNPSPGAVCGE